MWACGLQAEEKPTLKIQQGLDIHECIAKINSTIPTGSCNADSVLQKVIHHLRPYKGSYHPDIDRRRFSKSDLKMDKSGDRRFSRRRVDSAVPFEPSKAPSLPKTARTDDEGSLLNYDLKRGSKHSHRMRMEGNTKLFKDSPARNVKASPHTLQASRGRSSATKGQGAAHQGKVISHAGLDRASDDGSNCHPPMTLTISTERLTLVNSKTERSEDSSSFHTPNETLETHSAQSDSPCSSFREDVHPPNFPEFNASEGDQMSGVSQPPLETLAQIDEVPQAKSYATTQRAKKVEPRELQGLEGCGSISPIEERSSRKVSEQRSNFTVDTSSRLNVSEDAFHLTAELNDEWKRLERLHREVHAILFRK
jgi:hypothetical protein